jgi:4-amino-4-deoxy-L-arabinose transferase-like glycosyltransferase
MAIAAVYPQLVAISDSLLSETLFTPLVLAAVLCVLLQRRSGAGYRWAIGAGVFLGLTMLTRVNGVIISVGLLAGMWGLGPSRRVKGGALLILTSVLVILPWAVRDAVVFHTFVPLSDESGYTLAGTYNDISRTDSVNPAAWRPTPGPPYEAILRRRDLNEVQMNSKLEATALDYIGKHPTYLGKVVLWNGLRFLQVTGNSHEQLGARETGVGPTFSDVGRIAFWVLLTLACASIVLVSAARRVPSIVWSVPLLLLLSLIFVNASARYRTPMDAFLVLFAGALVAHLASLRPRAKSSAQPASLS